MTNKITFLVILILLPQISSLSQCDGTDADCNEPRNDRYSENKEEPNNKFQTAWRRLKKLSSEGFDFLQKKADVAHKGLHDASKLIQEHGMPVVKNIVDKVSTGGSEGDQIVPFKIFVISVCSICKDPRLDKQACTTREAELRGT
eukprot:m.94464 g.94464  ORF g.94464 m.94464 type:complete len:145 (+) comp13445_c0_seq3:212-646(+)